MLIAKDSTVRRKPFAAIAAVIAGFLSCAACAGENACLPAWVACDTKTSDIDKLNCYEAAAKAYREAHPQPAAGLPLADIGPENEKYSYRLNKLWTPTNMYKRDKNISALAYFAPYKQNYLLVDAIHNPASAPSSPNPANNVAASAVQSKELKFQISFKAPVTDALPFGDTLWFAYTQQSHWQVFNSADSRPFRETNYEPELIWSHLFKDESLNLGPWTARYLNVSAIHQSNGQSLPRSRSWNRIAAQLGAEYKFSGAESAPDGERLAVLIRPWWRVPERATNDDNPDITKYLGHGDMELDYWLDRTMMASALLRSRALQLDFSYKPACWDSGLFLHLQYFNGYGESLIDYDHKLHSFGVGISLPY